MSEKLSEIPPWVALRRARDPIPSFPRKRESSGRGLNTRDGTQRFQTASEKLSRRAHGAKLSADERRRGIFKWPVK